MKKIFSLLIFTTALYPAAVFAQSIENLGYHAGGTSGQAYGVTPDGTKVVGTSNGTLGNQAYIWNDGTGLVGIGDLPGGTFSSTARDISADGKAIVGRAVSANGTEAFLWREGIGMIGLGALNPGNFSSQALGVSADGSTVIGYSNNASGIGAFRWTQATGMVNLGDLGDDFYTIAYGISADGSVIVGTGLSASGFEAFRWENGVMTGLGDFAGGTFWSEATKVSSDGNVIVGFGVTGAGQEAFRWTQGTGMVSLGDLAGGAVTSSANVVNGDGSVILGFGTTASGTASFYWTQADGMRLLTDVLTDHGIDYTGWSNLTAADISDDGNVIVGRGTYGGQTASFLINFLASVVASPEDLSKSLYTVAQASQQASTDAMRYAPQGLFAAQNLSSISAPVATGPSFAFRSPNDVSPAAGDFDTLLSAFVLGSYGIGQGNDFSNDEWNGTIGISAEIADGLHIGVGALTGSSHQELEFGGKSDMDALGGLTLMSFEPGENGFRLYATAYAAHLTLDIERGYNSGGGVDISRGETDGLSYGGALKLGWEEELWATGTSFMPYIEGRYANTHFDSYTEEGGSMPAEFSKQDNDYLATRLGIEISHPVNDKLEVMVRPAWGHRLSDDGGAFSATVSGLSQSLSMDAGDRNWAEGTIGAKFQATEGLKFTTELTGRSGDTAEPAAQIIFGASANF